MSNFKKYISYILLLNLLNSFNSDIINLTDYKYPTISMSDKYIRIAILGTNDFHGGIFPNKYSDILYNKYSNGGGNYLYSYAKILKEEWGKQLLWLDGGDQFSGTMECMLSNCYIMKDYYNKVGLDGMAIGNHDFDYGQEFLKDFINQQNFPTLNANIYDWKEKKYLYELWKNVEPYHIYEIDINPKIKIGVIGLATKQTPTTTSCDVSNLNFEDYYDTTKKWTEYLRNEEKVDSVILLTHFGPKCSKEIDEKMKIGMWDSTSLQRECDSTQEIMDFLKKLKDNNIQIDGVVGAHVHDIVHHWISDIPVIESSGSDYFNILYLPFKNSTTSVSLLTNKINIEGPVPVCEKLWPNSKNCIYKYEDSSLMQDFIFHNKNITLDEELTKDLKFWNDIIDNKINNNLFYTNIEMSLDDTKETVLTNFVNDIGKIITESDICFFNLGGIRSTWYQGPVNEIDLFRMFPFNNTFVRFEMTGREVYHMFQNLAYYTLYPQSGTLQTYTYINSIYKMKGLTILDGDEEKFLDPNKVYKICTNDFLADGGSGMSYVRKWYKELRNKKDFGIIRELFYDYVQKMGNVTKEKFIDENHLRITIDN